jgi:nicotinate-nucleotide adenylyltransferase
MARLAERMAAARAIGDGRRVVATDIEARLHQRYTADTLPLLRRRFPRACFVWLMGADNLADLPRWRQWPRIVAAMPFAVLPRPGYNQQALAGQAARCLGAARRPVREATLLAALAPPAWMFLPAPQHAASATALRQAGRFAPAGQPVLDQGAKR